MPAGGSNKLLTPDECAERIGVTRRHFIENYRAWGIPVVRLGRYVRVRERALDQWTDDHTETF